MNFVLLYSLLFSGAILFLTAEKAALEKRVKELEESLATRNAEAEKVTKDAAAREEQFVNRVAFLTQNVRGKFVLLFAVYSNCIGLCSFGSMV